jgi:C-terminal processing protease CtpA/Prc
VNFVAAFFTLLLHSLLFVAVIKVEPPKKPPVNVAVYDEYFDDPMTFPDQSSGKGLACDKVYTGVGLQHSGNKVVEVAVNGPAWNAGIRVGDTLTDPWTDFRDRESRSHVILHYMRDGKNHTVKIKQDEICMTR